MTASREVVNIVTVHQTNDIGFSTRPASPPINIHYNILQVTNLF